MKMIKQFPIFLWAVLMLVLLPIATHAADLSPPEIIIEQASTKLKAKMQDPKFTQDFQQMNGFVEEVVFPNIDFDRIAILVLGKYWKEANDADKKRFTHEFKILLIRTYSRAFIEFKEWSMQFAPLITEEDANKVTVKTQIIQPGLDPIAVNYRMLNYKGAWKAYDITIDGVSLVTNYRTNFKNEIERTGSLTSVIDSLEKRNKEALASGKEPA